MHNQSYDFACNAYEYTLNREPELFKKTSWFVDNFHRQGHKCSAVHNLNSFEHLDLPELKTSSNESLNSYLQSFRSQISYMKQKHVMLITKTMIGVHNSKKNEKAKEIINNH